MDDELSCPHCAYEIEEWHECITYNQSSDFNDFEMVRCPSCDERFTARQRAILEFEINK